jgi:hypothetical protein
MLTGTIEVTKVCKKCGQEKPLSEYYRNSNIKGGYFNSCKACVCAASREYITNNHKRHLDYNRQYYHRDIEASRAREREKYYRDREKILAYFDEWRKNNKLRIAEFSRKHRRKNSGTLKAIAQTFLQTAVRAGRIVKPDHCQKCLKPFPKDKLHGHHEDYSRPYDVSWLCAGCHGARHREINELRRNGHTQKVEAA